MRNSDARWTHGPEPKGSWLPKFCVEKQKQQRSVGKPRLAHARETSANALSEAKSHAWLTPGRRAPGLCATKRRVAARASAWPTSGARLNAMAERFRQRHSSMS
jgi:hypothetical protein